MRGSLISYVGGGWGQNPFGNPDRLDPEPGAAAAAPGGTPATPPVQQAAPVAMTAEQLQAAAGPIVEQVRQTIDAQLAPVREQQTALSTRLDELAKPTRQAGSLFGGGAPGVRTGEDPLSSRPFQMMRAMSYAQGSDRHNEDNCKLELQVSRRLKQYYDRHGLSFGGVPSNGRETVVVPLSMSMLPEELLEDEFFAGEVRQAIAAGTDGASLGEMRSIAQAAGLDQRRVNQALSIFDDSAGGVFTSPGPHGDFIELIRANEVLSRAGATSVTLPPNGYLPFMKGTGSTTGYWLGESEAITPSEPSTSRMELRAKKAAALVDLPNELMRFGGSAVEAWIRADLARTLGLLVDTAGLEGVGSTNEPKGLINYAGIVDHTAGTVAADGNTFEPEDPAGMLSDVEEQDHDPERDGFTWVMRPKMWNKILNRRAAAHTVNVEDGNWLFPVNRDAIQNGLPGALLGHPVVKSTQVSNTRTKGSGTDLSYVLGGIFRHLIIGRVGVLEFAMTTEGANRFDKYQTGIRAIQFVDTGVRYEDAFVLCDTIDMDLPA